MIDNNAEGHREFKEEDRVKEWNRVLGQNSESEAATSPLEQWISKNFTYRKEEVDYLLTFNPEMPPTITSTEEFQKPVNIGGWTFLVVLEKTFPKRTETGEIPITVYLVLPNAEEIKKKFKITTIPCVRVDKTGAEYLEFSNMENDYSDYRSGCYSNELLVEKTIKNIQDWVSYITRCVVNSKTRQSKKNVSILSFFFGHSSIDNQEENFGDRRSRSKYIDARSSVSNEVNERCKKVVLSDRAYNQIFSETYSKIRTETGGLLLGHFENGVWYVVEASDPGINATFTTSYHEGDDAYENHICGVISRMYKYPLVFLGMWHRHPGSMDVFSGTDDQTNYKYAASAGNGCISALINIDPDFRITFYYAEQGSRVNSVYYTKVDVEVGDDKFENPEILKLASSNEILQRTRNGGN